jgi:DHA2 family multidrug resistance protein
MQQMMGYSATTAGLALSPGGLFAMMEVPIVGYMLSRGIDPRKMIFAGMLLAASAYWWMSSMNLQIAQSDVVLLRIVQILGICLVTVPVSTVIFRFLPKSESSQAAGLYALMRNEGGSIGIALVTTMLQRKAQLHQQILGTHVTGSSGLVRQYIERAAAQPGSVADHRHFAMARLYNTLQQQAILLSYMDQFRMLCGIMLCILPFILFLKRPPAQKQIGLDAH